MQLSRLLLVAASVALLNVAQVRAQVCTLALGTNGALGLSSDGNILGSEEGLGVAGTMTIASIGSNTITVSAPTRISGAPAGYSAGTEQTEVSYSGASGLSIINQSYTTGATDFSVGTIGLSVLTLHNRIVNPNGFAAGSYTTRTVVTCS